MRKAKPSKHILPPGLFLLLSFFGFMSFLDCESTPPPSLRVSSMLRND